ncbi:MAG TPA: arginine deiminase family protein [Sphingobacteriaceae bacterium]
MQHENFKINVSSEVGMLRRLLIHSPDRGLGKVVPSKAQDWLFEDIVHLDTVRRNEYDYYVKILMFFLDPDKVRGRLAAIDAPESRRSFYKPQDPGFHASDKVIELENLLTEILEDEHVRMKLVASVCAIEGCTYQLQQQLIRTAPQDLSKIFISGSMDEEKMIFAPIPNLIFTRDIGITINDHILLNKPAKKARSRETLLARYIFFNHPIFRRYKDNILEIPDTVQFFLRPGEEHGEKTTLEGGDVMVVSKDHLLIGCSERTSASGASEAIKILFERNVIKKATVVKIPHKRDFMHIDTLFTQVKRNVWVVLGSIARQEQFQGQEAIDFLSEKRNLEKPEVIQFEKGNMQNPRKFGCIEELLDDISQNDLKSTEKTVFIYSGNGQFPFDAREQWTDSCNLLAIKEGVLIGYDRNDKTMEAFHQNGFRTIRAADLIDQMEQGQCTPEEVENTLILIPSAELSRARGGFHCMSMPLFREEL